IDPNIGIVPVPDHRLAELAAVIPTKQTVPAVVEFVDIAGLVKGAAKGEGLGNKFLSHVRSCDAIAEVVRIFDDKNVIHVEGDINPISDIETIKTELILADLETVKRRVEKTEKELKQFLGESRDKLRDLRFKDANKQLKNVREIRGIKKVIARVLTLLSKKN
ncbi:MAG: 50S ribosomal protein L29, partial [bacterium]